MIQEVFIIDGVRTAIGSFGGSLASKTPIDLATEVTREALQRSQIDPKEVGHVAFGHVINTEPRDMYLSRVAAIAAGIPESTPAMNVNRLCGSGAQAIVSVAQSLMLNEAGVGVAGGAESMSQSPYILNTVRWGKKMGDAKTQDMMLGALNCPFGTGHMGVTAENVAEENSISRSRQDEFALASQLKAANALEKKYFQDQIVPLKVKNGQKVDTFEVDEHPKNTSRKSLSELPPVFKKEGTVTAGNSSGINDGAAALVLATEEVIKKTGVNPSARILGFAHAGVRPEIMGIGPIPAVQKLCKNLRFSVDDFDVIESNEAFAAQACAVNLKLQLDEEKVNPNGGAIALGHPVGATGAILCIKLLYELKRIKKRLGLVTMCIGGGQGIAIAIENLLIN